MEKARPTESALSTIPKECTSTWTFHNLSQICEILRFYLRHDSHIYHQISHAEIFGHFEFDFSFIQIFLTNCQCQTILELNPELALISLPRENHGKQESNFWVEWIFYYYDPLLAPPYILTITAATPATFIHGRPPPFTTTDYCAANRTLIS